MLLWWKSIAWESGISPREFNKCSVKDIEEVMALKSAVSSKQNRNRQVQDMMNKVRFK